MGCLTLGVFRLNRCNGFANLAEIVKLIKIKTDGGFMEDPTVDAALQFDQAEVKDLGGGGVTCGFCKKPIPSEYHQVNQMTACGNCRQMVEASIAQRPGMTGFLKALVAGSGAAAAGALVWFLIARFAHMELGIIAIAVGFVVGCAVRWGTGGRGGWLYQLLAIMLTYLAIVTSYMPVIAEGLVQSFQEKRSPVTQAAQGDVATPAANHDNTPQTVGQISPLLWVLVFVIACVAPFLAGASNFMGWIIIGIALYQAWKINKRAVVLVTGPYAVTATAPPEIAPPEIALATPSA